MMKVCIYCNRKYPDGDITFHKMPSDKDRRQKWFDAMQMPDNYLDNNIYLCSEHFEDSTYCCTVVNKKVHRFLHIHALPSIFEKKSSEPADNEAGLNSLDERIKESQNDSVQTPGECSEDEEKDYFYKVENGIIKRYLRKDLKALGLLSSREQESRRKKRKRKYRPYSNGLEQIINSETTEILPILSKVLHVEAPVKVEVLPQIELPIQFRNGELYSQDNICDLKTNDFIDHGPNIIFEDIKIDAQEIPFEEILEFPNENGVKEGNEVEAITMESKPIDSNSKTIDVLEKLILKADILNILNEKNDLNEAELIISESEPIIINEEKIDDLENSNLNIDNLNGVNQAEVLTPSELMEIDDENVIVSGNLNKDNLIKVDEVNEVEVTTFDSEPIHYKEDIVDVSENLKIIKSNVESEEHGKKAEIVDSVSESIDTAEKNIKLLGNSVANNFHENTVVTSNTKKLKQLEVNSVPRVERMLSEYVGKDGEFVNNRLERCKKATLIEHLKASLHYIVYLKEKLKCSEEENSRYLSQVTDLTNLLLNVSSANTNNDSN